MLRRGLVYCPASVCFGWKADIRDNFGAMLHIYAAAAALTVASVTPQETLYRWLTSSQLEALLRGSRIVEADNRPDYMRTPEEFRRNRHYVRFADNYEAHGSYSFEGDELCVEADGKTVCRRLLLDKYGQHWIVGRENSQSLTKITVQRTPWEADPWPSGEAEAISDLKSGHPIKLYTHVWGGERAGFRSPGLLYCDPDQNNGSRAAHEMFAFIPEANISEGKRYTATEQAMQWSASAFARAYNLTIYRQKRSYIRSLCPKVELERDSP